MSFKSFLLAYILVVFSCFSQVKDTSSLRNDEATSLVVKKDKGMSKPAKAALYSTILPGLGQIYNKSYWKAPIVYAALGGSVYMTWYNHKKFKEFDYVYTRKTKPELVEKAWSYRNLKDSARIFDEFGNYSTDYIKYNATFHRDWRDKFVIITAVMYVANIVEAHVDAHLKSFNVSEEVSIKVKPSIMPTLKGWQTSLELSFDFKDKLKKFDENSNSRLW